MVGLLQVFDSRPVLITLEQTREGFDVTEIRKDEINPVDKSAGITIYSCATYEAALCKSFELLSGWAHAFLQVAEDNSFT